MLSHCMSTFWILCCCLTTKIMVITPQMAGQTYNTTMATYSKLYGCRPVDLILSQLGSGQILSRTVRQARLPLRAQEQRQCCLTLLAITITSLCSRFASPPKRACQNLLFGSRRCFSLDSGCYRTYAYWVIEEQSTIVLFELCRTFVAGKRGKVIACTYVYRYVKHSKL